MADSTLLQSLIIGATADQSHRRQVETFIANGTIAIGDVVAIDTSKTGADRVLFVTKAGLIANGNGKSIGAALSAATAGQSVKVVVAGYAEVKSHAGLLIDNMLTASGTSAGTVDGRVAGDISPAFGIALEAIGGSGLVPALVYKQY